MVLLVFSTNRTYALDLYLIFASRTHFKKNEGELVDFPNPTISVQTAGQTKKTWVTPSLELPSQEVQLSRSRPLGSDGAPKE
jgi:hypothetical protein